jgi:tetrapyrrole methylase family protein/MazG family protein
MIVVGLGPAGADLLLPVARGALERASHRFVRTSRHPAVAELEAEGITFTSFDDVYDGAGSLEQVYETIVARLLEAESGARDAGGEVCFAVPGSPGVGERSVALLRKKVGERLRIIPGLSFVDLAWLRLGVDPTDGAHLADGQALPAALPSGPLLISHCHSQLVLSDVKLALLERLLPEAPVTVLQRLGLNDESVSRVPLADLDRSVEPDHLTSVFAELPPGGPGAAWERLVALIERLRAPGGCPWDAEQTHHTLARHLIEETYEVIEAIEALPASAPGGAEPVPEGAYEALEEELGDLACQVVFHSTFAREAGAFTVTDVLTGIHDKLVRRHPHVFGDVAVTGADQVVANWELLKREEKGGASLMDSVPRALPSLLYAHKLYRKATSAGLSWGTAGDTVTRAQAELEALRTVLEPPGTAFVGGDPVVAVGEVERRLGETLGALVYLARLAGIDAESALRGWAARFRDRFQRVEGLAAARGQTVEELDRKELAVLWEQAGDGPGSTGSNR